MLASRGGFTRSPKWPMKDTFSLCHVPAPGPGFPTPTEPTQSQQLRFHRGAQLAVVRKGAETEDSGGPVPGPAALGKVGACPST